MVSQKTQEVIFPVEYNITFHDSITRAETGIWFYSKDMQSTYEELKGKGVDITVPQKQEWGGIMSKVKDQDGNSFSIISSLPQSPLNQYWAYR